jgi:hypothetical protein
MKGAQNTVHVGFELPAVVIQRQIPRVAHHAEAGIGHDNVRRHSLGREQAHDSGDIAVDRDIAAMRTRLSARRAQLGRQRLELLDAARHQRHAHAACAKLPRQSSAYARGSTGDEHTWRQGIR